MSAKMIILIIGSILCVIFFLLIFPFTSQSVSGAIGMKESLNTYVIGLLETLLGRDFVKSVGEDVVTSIVSGGFLSALGLLLRVIGLLRKEESLKREDLVEVIGQVMAEKMPELPSLRDFTTKLSGKYAIVCPYCEAWNNEWVKVCQRCGKKIKIKGIPPARIPLPDIFNQLREYYRDMWGKYAERKLNDDLIRLGVSPEESILSLVEVIKSKRVAAA